MSNGSIRGSIGQGIYTRGSLGFNYSYKKNKFSIYTNVSGSVSKYGYSTDKDILFPADSWSEKIRTRSQSQYYSAGIGINYELSKKTEIGFLFAGRYSLYSNRDNQAADYVNNSGALISTNNNNTTTSNSGLLNSATFSLTHTFDTLMKQVSFLIDYCNQSRNDKTGFNNLFRSFINSDLLKSQQSLAENTANFLSGGLDFSIPFKKMNITTGIRASFTLNDNELSVYNTLISPQVLEDSLSNRFKYTENIQAAYFTIGRDFKKWSFQLGARLEYTQTVGDQTTTHQRTPLNYVQVNPQFLVMYKQTDNSTWKFNYYRDFYRPSYNELNPFMVYQSYFSRSTGNPYLKPSINHSFELSHSFKNLRTAIRYYYGKNGTSNVTLIDSMTLIQNRTTLNSEVSHYLGLNISYQIFDVKRWSLNTYLSTSYNTVYSNNTSVKFNSLNNFSAFLFLTAAYALDRKKTFFAELSASWLTPWVQHFESNKMRPSYSIEIKKTFLNKRMSLTLNLNNLLNRNRMSSRVTINGVTTHTTDFYDAQSIYFNLSYSFGNRSIQVNQKSSGSTGESGRFK
jgi:outer membrane receptor protein involved in Fe transport